MQSEWNEVVGGLYLPLRADGAIAAHEDFRIDEPKGAPASLLGLSLPLIRGGAAQDVGTPSEPLARICGRTDAAGALRHICTAMAGDRALALELFEQGYAPYDHPPWLKAGRVRQRALISAMRASAA